MLDLLVDLLQIGKVVDNTQDKVVSDAWNRIKKELVDGQKSTTNKPSTFALHMPPSCGGCPANSGCVYPYESLKCHGRLWRHVVLG